MDLDKLNNAIFITGNSNLKKWISRKAIAHVKRDLKRKFIPKPIASKYEDLILDSIIYSEGKDFYTKETLSWDKISTFRGGSKINDLPTIDHVFDSKGNLTFKLCSWSTNSCKSDLTIEKLKEFCKKILEHN